MMLVCRILTSPSSSPPFYPWDLICDFKQIILKGCTCGLVNIKHTESQLRTAEMVCWGRLIQMISTMNSLALFSATAGLKICSFVPESIL